MPIDYKTYQSSFETETITENVYYVLGIKFMRSRDCETKLQPRTTELDLLDVTPASYNRIRLIRFIFITAPSYRV